MLLPRLIFIQSTRPQSSETLKDHRKTPMKLNTLILTSALVMTASMHTMQEDEFRKLALELNAIGGPCQYQRDVMVIALQQKLFTPKTITSPCSLGVFCYKSEFEKQCEQHVQSRDDLYDASQLMLEWAKYTRIGQSIRWTCCCPCATLDIVQNSCTSSQKIQPTTQSNQMQ